MSKLVSITELKNRATQIIREIENSGNEVIITKHAVPVAIIRPLREKKQRDMLCSSKGSEILARAKPIIEKISAMPESYNGNSFEWVNKERR